jgi:hypothetical protein
MVEQEIIRVNNNMDFISSDEIVDESLRECPDRVLWDGIFWMEACLAVRRSVDWFQLNTIIDEVREEAFRAGIVVAGDRW